MKGGRGGGIERSGHHSTALAMHAVQRHGSHRFDSGVCYGTIDSLPHPGAAIASMVSPIFLFLVLVSIIIEIKHWSRVFGGPVRPLRRPGDHFWPPTGWLSS